MLRAGGGARREARRGLPPAARHRRSAAAAAWLPSSLRPPPGGPSHCRRAPRHARGCCSAEWAWRCVRARSAPSGATPAPAASRNAPAPAPAASRNVPAPAPAASRNVPARATRASSSRPVWRSPPARPRAATSPPRPAASPPRRPTAPPSPTARGRSPPPCARVGLPAPLSCPSRPSSPGGPPHAASQPRSEPDRGNASARTRPQALWSGVAAPKLGGRKDRGMRTQGCCAWSAQRRSQAPLADAAGPTLGGARDRGGLPPGRCHMPRACIQLCSSNCTAARCWLILASATVATPSACRIAPAAAAHSASISLRRTRKCSVDVAASSATRFSGVAMPASQGAILTPAALVGVDGNRPAALMTPRAAAASASSCCCSAAERC